MQRTINIDLWKLNDPEGKTTRIAVPHQLPPFLIDDEDDTSDLHCAVSLEDAATYNGHQWPAVRALAERWFNDEDEE